MVNRRLRELVTSRHSRSLLSALAGFRVAAVGLQGADTADRFRLFEARFLTSLFGARRFRFLMLIAVVLVTSLRAAEENFLPGLVATYSDGSHTVRPVVPSPNFYLEPQESVHPALGTAFEAEWSGLLLILQTGAYTLDCAGEIEINREKVNGKAVQLESGRHPIRIRFRRKPGIARLQLQWKSTHFALEPVPSSYLLHHLSAAPRDGDALVEKGRYLVEELGCVNCHASDSASLEKRVGPDLTGIGSRAQSRWLLKWLENPSALRRGGVMPAMLDEQQRRDVASHLASLAGKDRVSQARKPSRQDINHGRQLYGSLGCAACHQQEVLSLEGIGSKMSIASLATYLKDPSKVDRSGRMPSALLTDEEAFQLASFLAESRNAAFERPLQEGDPARGKELIISKGCLACHVLDDLTPRSDAPAPTRLEKLRPERGCLATEPKGVPLYRMNAGEREAIRAFLQSYQLHPDRSPAPVYTFRQALERLRCAACHQIDHRLPTGSPAEAAPPLTDTGGKLRTGWIAEVLLNQKRVLGWLELRMPHYDARVAQPLVDGFAKAFGVAPGDGPMAPAASDAQRMRGVELIGMNLKKGGMACLGCHDWGDFKSQGENGPELSTVAQRLRYDWFQRWMREPTRILSGTSMPAYFRSVKSDQADAVIHTLWSALSMGKDMPLPDGLRVAGGVSGSEEKPVPDREAIVIRWDMPEATPAAIAVGMPGKISYCFDAGESRLRYAWHGGFLDMSGTLRRKVDENRLTPTAKLIGETFYRPGEFPLRVGAIDRVPERRFRGYRLLDGYPQFHYQVDDIDVYERIIPAKSMKGLTRQFTLSRVDRPMWFLAGETRGVAFSSTVGPIQDGKLLIPRGAKISFEVTITKQE